LTLTLQNVTSPNPNFNATLAQAHVIQGFLTAFGIANVVCYAMTNETSDPPLQSFGVPESTDGPTGNIPDVNTSFGSLQSNGIPQTALINVGVVGDGINPQNVALVIHDYFWEHKGDPISQLNALAAGLGQGVTDPKVSAALLSIANAKAAVALQIDSALGLS